ncbi:gluconokinase [Ramlibacter sp. MMS24-I3-19]|uniref:gluconokinase n=1 Tax=Ramlibacter sp. MMS24-I3-19 TaxID=3416606 RepID=UPI003D073040
MGVAGCGKSTVGAAIASAEAIPLVEGDDFHSAASRDKMARGIALTDDDRAAWLDVLGAKLAAHTQGVVLTCSALKRAYRDRLRAAAPGLRFVFLAIEREAARERVAGRGAHFFSPHLVDSQFATLEPPVGEQGVLQVDALAPIAAIQGQVHAWLQGNDKDPS